jgi:integrase/ribosomal protein L37AE/L43A
MVEADAERKAAASRFSATARPEKQGFSTPGTQQLSKQHQPMPSCPECNSNKVFKDGLRRLSNGATTQRWLCRNCGYRFSEGNTHHRPKILGKWQKGQKSIKLSLANNNRQICAREAKNLEPQTETKTVAGELEKLPQDTRGLIAQFLAYLEKEGYSEETQYPNCLKRLVRRGADLRNPESVKAVIGKQKVKDGMKLLYVYAYAAFAKMLKISWEPPKYKQEETIPFIPDEAELDCLISACRSRRLAAYLQCLKETFGDPSEVLRIRWIDVDGNAIKINFPVKGHNPRVLQVSNKLLSMLNSLPKMHERIFPTRYANMFNSYNRLRKRTADLQKNPRLLSIELRTFRHWGGTMIAHYSNGNVLLVKKLLGHKRVENSMKYIGMIDFKDDEFEVTTATTIDEAKKVLSVGFDYVTEKNGIMLFRRPKRFSKYV